MGLEINFIPRFISSAFGKRMRGAEDTDEKGGTIKLPKNASIKDFIRLIYRSASIESFNGYFGFLDRDNKERQYDPGQDDPFVFRDWSSIEHFKKSAHNVINKITELWVGLGMPVTADTERNISVPDTSALADAILAKERTEKQERILEIYRAHTEDIAMLGSNLDIMKKAALLRTVTPGWWAVSYMGKNTDNIKAFLPYVDILVRAMLHLRSTPRFKKLLDETIKDQGDPLDTGVGYPLFKGSAMKEGVPEAKIEILEMFNNIGTRGYNWPSVREEIASRVKDPVLSRHPLAVAEIRRQGPGFKWSHIWKPTQTGLKLQYDERGHTVNRVAFMAPYVLNLYLSPIQSEWKTLRKMIPGLIFDGDIRTKTFAFIKSRKPYLMESDYSNYDRTIPNNLMKAFFAGYCNGLPHSDYYFALLQQTHSNLSLIWPDWTTDQRGVGFAFNVSELGLLSGLKITSEIGTFCNLLVVIKSLVEAKLFTEETIYDYLISQQGNSFADPYYLIASDDTLLIHPDLDKLRDLVNHFIANAELAGLKGKLEIGDRFLMRHMHHGKDTPLIARVWQNTLSNEEPYIDPLKFIVGLCARTDGLLGVKTVDPFKTGKNTGFTSIEKTLYTTVLQELLKFLESANVKVDTAVSFTKLLLAAIDGAFQRDKTWFLKDGDITRINHIRNRVVSLLATQELKKMELQIGSTQLSAWLNQLHKNAYSPTTSMLLDEITALSTSIATKFSELFAKEHQFYLYAMKRLGLNRYID